MVLEKIIINIVNYIFYLFGIEIIPSDSNRITPILKDKYDDL